MIVVFALALDEGGGVGGGEEEGRKMARGQILIFRGRPRYQGF